MNLRPPKPLDGDEEDFVAVSSGRLPATTPTLSVNPLIAENPTMSPFKQIPPNSRITLCGSTKFKAAFEKWNRRLSLEGHSVYSVAFFGHAGERLTAEQKTALDAVHLRKIDNSDVVFVLDVGGYLGESTRREIAYAESEGKEVRYLSSHPDYVAPSEEHVQQDIADHQSWLNQQPAHGTVAVLKINNKDDELVETYLRENTKTKPTRPLTRSQENS